MTAAQIQDVANEQALYSSALYAEEEVPLFDNATLDHSGERFCTGHSKQKLIVQSLARVSAVQVVKPDCLCVRVYLQYALVDLWSSTKGCVHIQQ